MSDIATFVQNLGLPTAFVVGLAWALYRKDQNSVPLEVYRKECERSERLEKSLDANTTAVERLIDSFEMFSKGYALGGK